MELVGKIDYDNNIKINPFNLDFNKFTAPECECCKTNHNRIYTYIIEKDNGELIQVGKGCLDKLLGSDFNYEIINYNNKDLFENLLFGFDRKNNCYNTRLLLFVLIQFNKIYGLVDSKKFNDYYNNKDFVSSLGNSKNWNFDEVDNIIEWYKNFKGINDFQINIKNLVLNKYLNLKYINYFKYVYKIYIDSKNYKPVKNSQVIDYTKTTIKEIEMVKSKIYSYGYRNQVETKIYRIIDINDNVLQYETSSEKNFKNGDTISYKIKGNYESKKYGIVNKISHVKGGNKLCTY